MIPQILNAAAQSNNHFICYSIYYSIIEHVEDEITACTRSYSLASEPNQIYPTMEAEYCLRIIFIDV